MDYLEPPLQLFNPPEDVPVILPVVRWEVGLANVPRSDREGNIVKPAIRFHLPGPGAWGLRPYADFTHQLLLRRVLRLYSDLWDDAHLDDLTEDVRGLEGFAPADREALARRI